MNKRGIDFTPSFAFGLLLGIAALIIGLTFLWSLYAQFTQQEKNSFQELRERMQTLKDGDDSIFRYIPDDTWAPDEEVWDLRNSIIGFDYDQQTFEIKTGPWSRYQYEKPPQCGSDYACLCSCAKRCQERYTCFPLQDIKKIDGTVYSKDVQVAVSFVLGDTHTFLIPPPVRSPFILRVYREQDIIYTYINP